jgi:hypothetical protein
MGPEDTLDFFEEKENEFQRILNSLEYGNNNFFDIFYREKNLFEETIKVLKKFKKTVKFDIACHQPLMDFKGLLNKNQVSSNFIPVRVKGDGNCLYQSVSLAVFGTEKFHITLRALTVYVLINNFIFFSFIAEKNMNFISYIESVAENHNFSGEVEEMALSFIFSRSIINYSTSPSLEFYCLSEKSRFNKEPLMIIFDSKKAHFSPILRATDTLGSFSRPLNAVYERRLEELV